MSSMFDRTPQEPQQKPKEKDVKTLEEVIKDVDINSKRKEQRAGERFEDAFKRSTYFIRRDLSERLDEMAVHQKRGFKTNVINTLLENFLDEAERLQKEND